MSESETDKEFVERASRTPCGKWPLIDHDRLFALARRGAEAADWERRTRAFLGDPLKSVTLPTLPPPPSGEKE